MKRSLNLAYLENASYDPSVAHLERELELSGLKNYEEMTIPTMTAVAQNDNQQNSEQTKIVCHYCTEPGLVTRDCRKRMKKELEQKNDPSIQNTRPSTSRSFAPCPHCQEKIFPQKNAGAVPMTLIDPNGSNSIIQQPIEIKGKNKEI